MESRDIHAHATVLAREAVDALFGAADGGGTYVDATFGRGGHSRLILARLSAQGRLIAFDRDPDAVAWANNINADTMADTRFSIRHAPFSQLGTLPRAGVAGVLMDLGVSSPQIDNPQRGFSFRFDGPLDMRMDTSRGQSVAQWLEEAEGDAIAEVIRTYGEERFAAAIARAIVARRKAVGPIASTSELASLVAGVVKTREAGQNPATRTFQALRIFINAELEELQTALDACLQVLQPGGRLVVISFHSLEDRIVKQFITSHSRGSYDRKNPFARPNAIQFKALGRVRPDADEVRDNPRARSAIMRVAQRVAA